MVILSRLFGGELRVKMMRLFILNADKVFDISYIEGKTNARPRDIEKEIDFLRKTGLVKTVKMTKTFAVKKGKKIVHKKSKIKAYVLDKKFKYVDALGNFLVNTQSIENKTIVKRLARAGKVKAVVVSGIFTGEPDSRLDLFVVGDNVKPATMDRIVKGIESDMGKDIRYVFLSAADFEYRLSMNDKLIRDIIDYPHTVLLDKIGLSHQ